MAYGDIGGAVTELIITCQTPDSGPVNIEKGDAVKLTGPYTVDNATYDEDVIFGQAMIDMASNTMAIPIKVRGICIFSYAGPAPSVDGVSGVMASAIYGWVKVPASGNGKGINLKVDTTRQQVHVLL